MEHELKIHCKLSWENCDNIIYIKPYALYNFKNTKINIELYNKDYITSNSFYDTF